MGGRVARNGRRLVRRGSPTLRAERRIGQLTRQWAPGSREAFTHAWQAWEDARRAVAARADVLEREAVRVGAGVDGFNGQVDLVLLGALGSHLAHCPDCWIVWIDGWRPGDILTGAVRRRPAGAVLKAAELEAKARRMKGSA
jgi:hypothetical protein